MCLGRFGTIAEVLDDGRAIVVVDSGAGDTTVVSLAVLIAEGTAVEPGDVVVVSMGMALRVVDDVLAERASTPSTEVVR